MKIQKFTFNPFQENTYVLSNEKNEALIFDPGCYEQYEEQQLVDYLEKNNLKLTGIYTTHCHLDHVFGAKFLCEKYKLDFTIPASDTPTYQMSPNSAKFFGIQDFEIPPAKATLKPGKYHFGEVAYEILFTPGHCVGHIAFYFPKEQILIGGDVLFKGSIGRTDLPGGDFDTLEKSIVEKIYTLPAETIVFSGHGEETTVGAEMYSNPFVKL